VLPSGFAGLLVAIAIGFVFVITTFELQFILGVSSFWQTEVDDVTQYIAGFNMYFGSPWRFPLLAFDSLNYPQGTRATFVDVIPLYALLLKLLLPASLAPFNPYGAWVALCFILQAVGGWWISRELRLNSWAFLVSLVIVLLVFPALMARLGHISLMSHWIILFALALYVRSRYMLGLPLISWTVLLVVAFYVNIYLFAMAAGIYFAAFLARGAGSRRILIDFSMPFFLIALSLFVTLLPLPEAGVAREGGFGYFSMNVLSPVLGGDLFKVKAGEAPGQYEGFNYLGFGVILALIAAVRVCHIEDRGFFRRHWPLSLLMVGFSVYALSSQIYFGSVQILEIKYPRILDVITSQFRASGRFFWPVGYCIVIFALLMLFRRLGRVSFAVVALMIVLLQLVDLKERYSVFETTLARESRPRMNYALWDEVLKGGVQKIYFYPKFKCGAKPPFESLLPVMRYAAERNYKLNTGYIARYSPRCDDIAEEIAASAVGDSAYVFAKEEFGGLVDVKKYLPVEALLQCREVDFAFVCSRSG